MQSTLLKKEVANFDLWSPRVETYALIFRPLPTSRSANTKVDKDINFKKQRGKILLPQSPNYICIETFRSMKNPAMRTSNEWDLFIVERELSWQSPTEGKKRNLCSFAVLRPIWWKMWKVEMISMTPSLLQRYIGLLQQEHRTTEGALLHCLSRVLIYLSQSCLKCWKLSELILKDLSDLWYVIHRKTRDVFASRTALSMTVFQ